MPKKKKVTTGNPARHCIHKAANGKSCGGYPMEGSQYCYAHNPAIAEERRASQSKGGLRRHGREIGSTGTPPELIVGEQLTADYALTVLHIAVTDALALEKSLKRSHELGYLAGIANRLIDTQRLEARIANLEKLIEVIGAGDEAK